MTPFDRDDMYRLATVIDDICDHVDEAADNIDAYEVRDVPAQARSSRREVVYRAASISTRRSSCSRASGTRSGSSSRCASSRTRATGSRARRSPSSSAPGADPLTIIRWKDIHEQIEEAVDACENAADVLEAILVKNR